MLRSKTPNLVKQEFYGFMMAHFAVRGLMHEVALAADENPDRLSFLRAVQVIQRKLPAFSTIPAQSRALARTCRRRSKVRARWADLTKVIVLQRSRDLHQSPGC
ncbi:MAG: hypothetical protein JO189_23645 [Deltaproteobacteria bacterium]|nr:hypothetical protein [Deltaproteobacteria bacterium]